VLAGVAPKKGTVHEKHEKTRKEGRYSVSYFSYFLCFSWTVLSVDTLFALSYLP